MGSPKTNNIQKRFTAAHARVGRLQMSKHPLRGLDSIVGDGESRDCP